MCSTLRVFASYPSPPCALNFRSVVFIAPRRQILEPRVEAECEGSLAVFSTSTSWGSAWSVQYALAATSKSVRQSRRWSHPVVNHELHDRAHPGAGGCHARPAGHSPYRAQGVAGEKGKVYNPPWTLRLLLWQHHDEYTCLSIAFLHSEPLMCPSMGHPGSIL